MKKILLFSALSMLALVACSSDDPDDGNPSSSSEGAATLPSSSSGGVAPPSSSSIAAVVPNGSYCYDAEYDVCLLIDADEGCYESESECTSDEGLVKNATWCQANARTTLTCDGIPGSCIFSGLGGQACVDGEEATQDICEAYEGVFASGGICNTSIFSSCLLEAGEIEEVECVAINSTFTKDKCFEQEGFLVTPSVCEMPPQPSEYAYCYDYDGEEECARLIGGCWAGSTTNSCESMGGTVTTKEWCEDNNVSSINHCYTPAEMCEMYDDCD